MQIDMTLTNHGLIAANNVSLGFGEHPFYKIEPLVGSIGSLGANSSLTVPVKITRIADFDASTGDVPCQISAGMRYGYEVAGREIQRSVPIAIFNVEGNCLPPVIGTTIIGFPNFYGGGGGGGNNFNGGSYSVPIDISPLPVDGTVQARVKISIDQEAVMTRAAFLGSLEIDNGNATSLENISVVLEVKDQNGIIVNNLFGITQPILSGITAVDGTGILSGNNPTTPIDEGIGSAKWTFIPTNLAAPAIPTQYSIGGQLSYTENGARITVPLIAAPITVFPQAELYLDYFQQRNVYGDDPFTSNIETAVPFSLGVLVRNEGKGDAKNLRITSSQPKIIDNQQGLLVDFEIIGSEVNGTGVSPSLAVNFGNIAAGGTAVADWQLKSSIQGKFSDYKATFEHVNSLGIAELSLIKDVKVHELIHQVKADRPTGDDSLPDFLVNEVADANFRPDTIYFSNGGTATVAFATGTADAPIVPSDKVALITATTTPGWSYIELVDPAAGRYQVKSVVRSDGKVIKADNVWLTDRTFPATGRPTYENVLHLVDYDSTGSYTITYTSGDTVSPTADIIDVTPDPISTAVGSIDVVFSEAIQGSTFNYQDLTLTLNGGANLITSTTSVNFVADNTYRITGLNTSSDGQYELTLNTSGINDLEGNAGTINATDTWIKATGSPAVLAINGITNPLRNTAVSTLEVAFSQDITASTLGISDLSLTLNGGPNLLTSSTTITAISGNTYQIGNIQGLTGNSGNYVFSVNATGVQNLAGNAGVGNSSVNWQLDNIQPAVQSVDGGSITNRRQPVQQVEVTFSEAIDITTLTASDIILTRNGVAVPLSNLNITGSSNGKYLIEGLAAAQTTDGNYQLTVNGAGVNDAAGNTGTSSASANWSIDTIAPNAATGITISPDNGISGTDFLTNSLALTVVGNLSEAGTQVSLKDLSANDELGAATVTGNAFSQNLLLNNSGDHQIQVRVTDAAGNFTDSTFNVFVDQSAPTSSFVNTPSPSLTGISSIDIAFSESINASSFTLADLSLTRDGVAVNLSGATIAVIGSSNNYQLSGLSTLTATPGEYALSLNNTGVVDRAGNAGLSSTVANFTVTPPPNAAPTAVTLSNVASLSENTSTANRLKVADIGVTDDGRGTNNLSLSGTDASSFEIVDNKLYVKAGTNLNFESKPSYVVTVEVDDATVGSSPDALANLTLNIIDVNEAPTAITLVNTLASIAENTSITTRLKVANINVTDDAIGTNNLSLIGADASNFEIFGTGLYVKAGTSLNFESKSSYAVTVAVNDVTVGSNPDASTTFNLTLTDVNEATGIINGTNAADNIPGTAGNDTINGLDGNDTIRAGMGDDIISGGNNNDNLYGEQGNDTIDGGSGIDNIYGGLGQDSLIGGLGNDYIDGEDGNDTVEGGYGNDYLYGGNGNDRVLGGSDDDYIDGGLANDYVDGESGNDNVTGGYGVDAVYGGLGNDTVDGGVGTDVDSLFGGAGVDTFVLGKTAADRIGDFATGELLQISVKVFGGGLVANTALQSNQLLIGSGSATATTRFIYNNGDLFFDADGSATGFAAVKIATLDGNPSLAVSNFSIIK
jgi:Ca2+-binding RTX toxin-like protein